MVQYSARLAWDKSARNLVQGSVEASLLRASEEADWQVAAGEISDIVKRLFRDASVSHRRVSARGDEYSIVDGVCLEYVSWYNMPWE